MGYNGTTYKNKTGRNDITDSRVTYDAHNVYFMVQTAEALSPYTDPAWMRLFLDVEGVNDGKDWESFEYVINRVSPTAGRATLERSQGGWNWETVCTVKYTVSGNTLVITVPRAAIGVDTGNEVFTLNFKWSDNMQTDGDIMDFYENGDVAPGGRFKYQFTSLVESFTAEELIPPATEEEESEASETKAPATTAKGETSGDPDGAVTVEGEVEPSPTRKAPIAALAALGGALVALGAALVFLLRKKA
jgi:hypothetical protein